MSRVSDSVWFNIPGVYKTSTELPRNLTGLTMNSRNHLMKLCLGRAVTWFLEGYLKLRFNPSYARKELGYQVVPGTWRNKQRQARSRYADAILPNVWTGATRDAVMNTTRARTTATRGNAKVKIVINMPGYVNQQTTQVTNRTVRKIARNEAEKIALRFFAEVNAASARAISVEHKTRNGSITIRSAAGSKDIAEFGRFDRGSTIIPRSGNTRVAVGE